MKISFIYIISDGENYKVGMTRNDPEKRLKQLQTGNPKVLKIISTFKVPESKVFKLEKEAHVALQKVYVKRGEWFQNATEFHVNIILDQITDGHIVST